MIRILIAAALLALLTFYLRSMYRRHGRKMIWPVLFGSAVIAVLGLALSGRIHWIGGIFAALLAVLRYLAPLLWRFSPALLYWLQRRFGRHKDNANPGPGNVSRGKMNREEALATLGLKEGASRAEIVEAHRRLIQKVHPDRRGSEHLASAINRARDVLLS